MTSPDIFAQQYGHSKPTTPEELADLVKMAVFQSVIELTMLGLDNLFEQARLQGLVDETYLTAYTGNNPSTGQTYLGSDQGRTKGSHPEHAGKSLLD